MIQIDYGEIIGLSLGLFVLVFIIIQREQIQMLAGSRWLIAAYGCQMCGSVIAAADSMVPGASGLMHVLQEACYATSVVLIAVWVWRYPVWKESGS